MRLSAILRLFLTFLRFEPHYSYKNNSYKKLSVLTFFIFIFYPMIFDPMTGFQSLYHKENTEGMTNVERSGVTRNKFNNKYINY